MLLNSIFAFSHNFFYPVKDKYHHLSKTQIVCKSFQFQQDWNFVVLPHNPDPEEEGFWKKFGKRKKCW